MSTNADDNASTLSDARSMVKICFVKIDELNADEKSLLQTAFQALADEDLAPEWISNEDCLTLTKKRSRQMFVMAKFGNDSFQHLLSLRCSIVGPALILGCLKMNKSLPRSRIPVLSDCMCRAVVSCTNIKKNERDNIYERIQSMYGRIERNLTGECTVLVAVEVGSAKYKAAVKQKTIEILTPEWVYESWRCSHYRLFDASDPEFCRRFKCPVFAGLTITVSSMSTKEKKAIEQLIRENGGKYSGDMKQGETTHLITNSSETQKYKMAKRWVQWPIFIVSTAWLHDSISLGYCQDEKAYLTEDVPSSGRTNPRVPSVSTPNSSFAIKEGRISLADPNFTAIPNMHPHILDTPNASATFSCADETVSKIRGAISPNRKRSITAGSGSRIEVIDIDSEETNNCTPLEQLDLTITTSGDFLQGCRIFLLGFSIEESEKLRKIINAGGGNRSNKLQGATHAVLGLSTEISADMKSKLKAIDDDVFIVTSNWLVNGFKQGKRLPESMYRCASSSSEHSVSSMPVKRFRSGEKADENVATHDVLSQYLSGGLEMDVVQCQDAPEPTSEVIPNIRKSSVSTDALKQIGGPDGVFEGKSFAFIGLTEEEEQQLCEIIENVGGSTPASQKVDFLIASLVENGERKHGLKGQYVANSYWIRYCVNNRVLVSPLESPAFNITEIPKRVRPLANCVLCISQYSGIERDFLHELATALGAKVQAHFAKSAHPDIKILATTHLVIASASGDKYGASKRWNLPAVTSQWLVESARALKQLDPAEFPPSTSPISPSVSANHIDTTRQSSNETSEHKGNSHSNTLESVKKSATTTRKQSDRPHVLTVVNKLTERVKLSDPSTPVSGNANATVDTPGKFMDSRRSFHPAFCLQPSDIASPSAAVEPGRRDTAFLVERYLNEAVATTSAKEARFDGPFDCEIPKSKAVANVQVAAATTPARHGPLVGVIAVISKRLSGQQTELNNLIRRLGGDYRWKLDPVCTHLIYQGKSGDREFRSAQQQNLFIVSPAWLRACRNANRRVDESQYPPDEDNSHANRSTTATTKHNDEPSVTSAEGDDFAMLSKQSSSIDVRNSVAKQLQTVLERSSLGRKRESVPKESPSSVATTEEKLLPCERPVIADSQEEASDFVVDWEDPNQKTERERVGGLLRRRNDPTQMPTADEIFAHVEPEEHVAANSSHVVEKLPVKRVFQLTAINNRERESCMKIIKKLGGTLSDMQNFDPDCTHMITGNPTRNEKLLAAIACGLWVLHYSYIEASDSANQFVNEIDFEFGSPSIGPVLENIKGEMAKLVCVCPKWRLHIEQGGSKAYHGWQVLLIAERVKEDGFVRILNNGGAVVTKDIKKYEGITHVIADASKLFDKSLKEAILRCEQNGAKCYKTEIIFAVLLDESTSSDYLLRLKA